MKKTTLRQLKVIELFIKTGNVDSASRSLSALIRSSMSEKEVQELWDIAKELKLNENENFII